MNRLADVRDREAARDTALTTMTGYIPYASMLGVIFERRGDEITARMPFAEPLVGNPLLPAIHGGVTGAFLEITAQVHLGFMQMVEFLEEDHADGDCAPQVPKTIDITIDYLRSGRPRETFARAVVQKAGRRVAHVHVTAWQDDPVRPTAMMRGNFLMP